MWCNKRIVCGFISILLMFLIIGCGPSEQDVLNAVDDTVTTFTSVEIQPDNFTYSSLVEDGFAETTIENEEGTVKWDVKLSLDGEDLSMDFICNIVNYLGIKTDSIMNGTVKCAAQGNVKSKNDFDMSIDMDIVFDSGKVKQFKTFIDNEVMEHRNAIPEFYVNNKKFVFDDYTQLAEAFGTAVKLLGP